MNSVTPICYFRSNRKLSVPPKHTPRCHRFHNRKNNLPLILCFFWSSSTQWILSSTSITFFKCFVLWLKGQTLLENWCQKGRERSHQSLSLKEITSEREYHLLRGRERSFTGRERSPGGENTSRKYFSRISDAWCSRGEMPHVFLRGKTCSCVLICISLH